MSVSIIVERSPADRQGPDVVDPLISSVAQAIQRGRKEIDENSTNRFQVSGANPLYEFMEPCSLVQVTDMQKGNYRGVVLNYSISISRDNSGNHSAMSSVVIERESE